MVLGLIIDCSEGKNQINDVELVYETKFIYHVMT